MGHEVSAAPIVVPHGAKIALGRANLVYGDERLSGGTDFVTLVSDDSASVDSEYAGHTWRPHRRASGRSRRPAHVQHSDEGLSIGRDPGCDIVLGIPGVSRRHADIVPGSMGYVIKDSSMNGIDVNGARVSQSRWRRRRRDPHRHRGVRVRRRSRSLDARLGPARRHRFRALGVANGGRIAVHPLPSLRMEDGALAMIELMSGGPLRGRRWPSPSSPSGSDGHRTTTWSSR